LKGARIGIPARLLLRPHRAARRRESPGGLNDAQRKVMDDAIAVLKQRGAVIVDPANIPSVVDKDPKNNFMLWNTCSGVNNGRGKDENCSIDFKYGMKRDFNKWLASLGPAAPLKSLQELIAWNTAHQKAGSIKYGQSNLDVSDEMDLEKDRARYEADRAKDVRLGGTHGMDEIMKAERLDAILFPRRTERRSPRSRVIQR
jgi:amidase